MRTTVSVWLTRAKRRIILVSTVVALVAMTTLAWGASGSGSGLGQSTFDSQPLQATPPCAEFNSASFRAGFDATHPYDGNYTARQSNGGTTVASYTGPLQMTMDVVSPLPFYGNPVRNFSDPNCTQPLPFVDVVATSRSPDGRVNCTFTGRADRAATTWTADLDGTCDVGPVENSPTHEERTIEQVVCDGFPPTRCEFAQEHVAQDSSS